MNRYKLNYILEYIKQQSEFPFDVLDVNDGVEPILAYYGLHPELDDDEKDEIRAELVGIASECELAEIARLVDRAEPVDLGWTGPQRRAVTWRERGRKSADFGAWAKGVGLA